MTTQTNRDYSATTPKTTDAGRHASMSDVKQDVKAVREDLGALKHDAVEVGAAVAEDAMEKFKHGAQSVADAAKSVRNAASESHKKVCKHVSANPTASILIAVGVGAIIGRLMARR